MLYLLRPVKWLKIWLAHLLKCVNSMEAVTDTHFSFRFSSSKLVRSFALVLASVPGVGLLSPLYACWRSASYIGIMFILNPWRINCLATSTVGEHHALCAMSGLVVGLRGLLVAVLSVSVNYFKLALQKFHWLAGCIGTDNMGADDSMSDDLWCNFGKCSWIRLFTANVNLDYTAVSYRQWMPSLTGCCHMSKYRHSHKSNRYS